MRTRPSSRLLILNSENQLLLFKFAHVNGPLAGRVFWATPGGGVEAGESFQDAARRELMEETGLINIDPGAEVHQRQVIFQMPDGDVVAGDERYFVINAPGQAISNAHWTEFEREVMADHRWWSAEEITMTSEQVWPDDLVGLLMDAGFWDKE